MVLENFTPPKKQAYLKSLNDLMVSETKSYSDVLSLSSNLSRYLSYGELARLLVRYELLKLIKNQSGDIVEFGVFMGSGITNFLTLSELLEPHNWTRRIIGFDTFEGLKTTEKDYGKLKAGMYKYSNKMHLEKVLNVHKKNKLRPLDNIKLIKGDVLQTLPLFIKNEPSFLPVLVYLDLDLFGPTKFVLEVLMPFLRPGCIVAFDELGMSTFPGETKAFIESDISKIGQLKKFEFAKVSYIQI
jgi:hypothetical protein